MKNLLLITTLLFAFSCSSSDDNDSGLNLNNSVGTWTLTGSSFTGNGVSGEIDDYYYGSEITFEKVDNTYYTGDVVYPNSISGGSNFYYQNNVLRFKSINDEGIKVSNSVTTFYDQEEMLIDSNGNEIIIPSALDIVEIEFSSNSMTITREQDGYTITYVFNKN